MEQYDVIVVGAGWNGLVASKTFLDLAPSTKLLIVDDGRSIGGSWSKEKVYPDLYAQANHPRFEYSCYPMSKDGVSPDGFISGAAVHEYLKGFATEFKLVPRIRLSTRIAYVDRDATTKQWLLTTKENTVLSCAKLIYATGPTSSPVMPTWPGQDENTPIIHSQQLGAHKEFLDKHARRVTIVGSGKSALDTAFLLAKADKEIDWLVRDSTSGPMAIAAPTFLGMWNIIDHVATRAAASFSPSIMRSSTTWDRFLQQTWIGRLLLTVYWRVYTFICDWHAGYENSSIKALRPKPAESFMFWGRGGIGVASAPNFWSTIQNGQIQTHTTEIKCFSPPNNLHLHNGETLHTDLVILCTGYDKGYHEFSPELKSSLGLYNDQKGDNHGHWAALQRDSSKEIDRRFPFLSQKPAMEDSQPSESPNLHYRRMIVPHLAACGDRSIIFPGQIHSVFTPLTGEIQAVWGAAFLLGWLDLPTQVEMEREVSLFNAWTCKRYQEQGRKHAYFIYDFQSYIDTLLDDLGVEKYRKDSFIEEWFLPYGPAQYRGIVAEYVRRRQNMQRS